MKKMILLVVLGVFQWSGALANDSMTANDIIEQMDKSGAVVMEEGISKMTLTIINKKGKKRVRQIETKGKKKNGLRKMLVTFISPEDVAGTAMLSVEQANGDDLQYLYLSALKDTRRIAGSQKNDNFMGTDFSYSDFEKRGVDSGSHTRLADVTVSGIEAYRVDTIPSDPETQYSKMELWIDKKDYVPLKIYFYDKKGKLFKKLISQMIEPIEGKMAITKLLMKNVQKGSKTMMELNDLSRKANFPDSLLEPENLGK